MLTLKLVKVKGQTVSGIISSFVLTSRARRTRKILESADW